MNGEYRIVITKSAQKDKEKIKALPALKNNVDILLAVLRNNPFQNPPPYERLQGSFSAYYQHRLVYTVDEAERVVKIVSMWTHYEQL